MTTSAGGDKHWWSKVPGRRAAGPGNAPLSRKWALIGEDGGCRGGGGRGGS